jgi:hypothetical protein
VLEISSQTMTTGQHGGAKMHVMFSSLRILVMLCSLLLLLAATASPAAATPASSSRPGVTSRPNATLLSTTTTDCHWHTDGNVYWAHCYDTGAPYFFQMHVVCSFGPDRYSNSAHSPEQQYTEGINCWPGTSVQYANVATSG